MTYGKQVKQSYANAQGSNYSRRRDPWDKGMLFAPLTSSYRTRHLYFGMLFVGSDYFSVISSVIFFFLELNFSSVFLKLLILFTMQEKTRRVFMVSTADWVLNVRIPYLCEDWEQRHAKYHTGEVTPGESLAPRNQPFPLQVLLLEPPSGLGLESLFFCFSKEK